MNPSLAIQLQIDLDASQQQVWDGWTTPEGICSFFAQACNIELRPGGPYEIFFDPDRPAGQRGADDMIVLAFQAPTFLSFTWNAPLTLPAVRPHMSHVTIRLEKLSDAKTRLHFSEDGFGEGAEWEQRIEYFWSAWGKVVLPRLAYSFAKGPVNWEEYQDLDLTPYQQLVKRI